MVGITTALLAAPGNIGRRIEITVNLLKRENRSAPSQCGLDFISISSRRRSIFIDFPFRERGSRKS
jgi:hypothetical protein